MTEGIVVLKREPVPGTLLTNVTVGLPNLAQATITVPTLHVDTDKMYAAIARMLANRADDADMLAMEE